MKYQHKKRVFNLCVTAPVLLVPLIAFVAIGLETGLLPKFWELIYTELPQSDENHQVESRVGQQSANLGKDLLVGDGVMPIAHVECRDVRHS